MIRCLRSLPHIAAYRFLLLEHLYIEIGVVHYNSSPHLVYQMDLPISLYLQFSM